MFASVTFAIVSRELRGQLVELGLSPAEAQVYLTLVRNTALSASAVAETTGLSRTSVYQMLCALADKGLVEPGTGYGSKFAVTAPAQALPALIAREREALLQGVLQREQIAQELADQLTPLTNAAEPVPEELIQVIRSPRAVAERFERLQLEAKRQVDIMVRTPILNPRRENPGQQKAQRLGVHFRCLYGQAIIEDPEIKPYLKQWIKGGEEARVYSGVLPHKLVIFDCEVVLLPLTMPGDQMRTLLIRHHVLAMSLSMLFDSFWERSDALTLEPPKKVHHKKGSHAVRNQSPSGEGAVRDGYAQKERLRSNSNRR